MADETPRVNQVVLVFPGGNQGRTRSVNAISGGTARPN